MLRAIAVLAVLLAIPAGAAATKIDDEIIWLGKKQQKQLAPATPEQASCLYMSGTKITDRENSNWNKTSAAVFFRRSGASSDDFALGINGREKSKYQNFEIRQGDRFGSTSVVCLAPGKYEIARVEFYAGKTWGNTPIGFELERGKDYYLGEFAFAEKYFGGAPCMFSWKKEQPGCEGMIEIHDALARDEPLFQNEAVKPRGPLQRLHFSIEHAWNIADKRTPAD